MVRRRAALRSAMLVTACAVAPVGAEAQEQLPTVEVVGVSPVAGSEIDRDKVPAAVLVIGAPAFEIEQAPGLLDAIFQAMPFVSLGDQSGNQFQRNLDYRGFPASP